MPTELVKNIQRFVTRVMIMMSTLVLTAIAALILAWNTRADIAESGLHAPLDDDTGSSTVTFTWFGVTTVLFDDGETQILVDGFISRPSLFDTAINRNVTSDAPMINYILNEYDIGRLAAIVPVHSHFDHAMDVGAIANRSSASIIGSETTANIARGVGVPEDQIIVAEKGGEFSFGNFTIALVPSVHAPVGLRGEIPLPGTVDEPLQMPAPVTAWREGGSYSIVVAHPEGTTIVQGSAGFISGALDSVRADVVMLSVGLLESLGRDYAETYWQDLVTATGAKRVFPLHFDDFTQPLGTIRLPPMLLDNFVNTARWLQEFRDTWDTDTQIFLPEFGRTIPLYPEEMPDA
jgi:L-ascorbate metabolism protein UlaG (beta-lactamase superfamily)